MHGIRNFYSISASLACAGQPSEVQFQKLAEEGFLAVVNLGLLDQPYSLGNEKETVEGLGILYHHIPVEFDAPHLDQLADFSIWMEGHHSIKTLVHCAANYRAVTFTSLHLYLTRQATKEQMEKWISDIWVPNPIWQSFIDEAVNTL